MVVVGAGITFLHTAHALLDKFGSQFFLSAGDFFAVSTCPRREMTWSSWVRVSKFSRLQTYRMKNGSQFLSTCWRFFRSFNLPTPGNDMVVVGAGIKVLHTAHALLEKRESGFVCLLEKPENSRHLEHICKGWNADVR